jgi:predicted enzyme related to lactoylglutathione lyase
MRAVDHRRDRVEGASTSRSSPDPEPAPRPCTATSTPASPRPASTTCLSVDSVDDTLAALRERGVDVVNPPFEIEEISARLAFFRDPWGNMFELSEHTGSGDHNH